MLNLLFHLFHCLFPYNPICLVVIFKTKDLKNNSFIVVSHLHIFLKLHYKTSQAMLPALDAILGHKSAHSFATGPVIAEPFISPLLFTITPALSSKYIKTPSFLRKGFLCLITTAGITFLRSSGLPFFTVATIMSPEPAAGRRLRRPPIPWTAITYRFFAPIS